VLLELHGWIPDLVAAHLEELEFLWPQWAEARCSPDYLVPELGRLEERIEANLDALVLAGDEAETLIEEALGAPSAALVRSAAMVMLHSDPASREVLLGRLGEATPAAALALAEALGAVEPASAVERATEVAIDAQAPAAVLASAWTLALWGRPIPGPERVRLYLTEPEPALRRRLGAWRASCSRAGSSRRSRARSSRPRWRTRRRRTRRGGRPRGRASRGCSRTRRPRLPWMFERCRGSRGSAAPLSGRG
jgi:hypothetical protein